MLQLLIWQIVKPEAAFVFGGSYKVPVMHKLLDRNFVKDLRLDGTFNETSFEREYESKWSGSLEDAFFSPELFDKYRTVVNPEYEAQIPKTSSGYYIISVDVGRIGCQSVAVVFKVLPQTTGVSVKTVVNIYTYEEEHFGIQALQLKRLYYKYMPKQMIIDGAGLGVGLIDFMVVKSEDPITREVFPPFGITNDDEGIYKKFKTDETEENIIYIIKATPDINTEAHTNVLSQISSGKVKFLIDEREAKAKFLNTKAGKEASSSQRANYLKPFTLTSILREEMLNLKETLDGRHLKLSTVNKNITKDKFSAFEYGLYYIKKEEDDSKRKRRGRLKDFMFFTPGR